MALRDDYRAQVDLLLRCLPAVDGVRVFTLMGGTAINLFHPNMPRLSVDIDLTYLPDHARAQAIANIHSELEAMTEVLRTIIPLSRSSALNDRVKARLDRIECPRAEILDLNWKFLRINFECVTSKC